MQHKCIKIACGQFYENDEPDAYYCPSCVEKNKRTAEEINSRIHPVNHESNMKKYDALPKIHGFPNANSM